MRDKIGLQPTSWLLILIVAVVVCVSTALPGYLLLRGLPWPWALALLVGFAVVAVLSIILGRALKLSPFYPTPI